MNAPIEKLIRLSMKKIGMSKLYLSSSLKSPYRELNLSALFNSLSLTILLQGKGTNMSKIVNTIQATYNTRNSIVKYFPTLC
jgi:GTP cyclohydrolase FolE2